MTTENGPEILGEVRIGAADRELYYTRLSNAVGADRISVAEHDARLNAIAKARTRSELDHLVSDLPAPAEPLPSLRKRWQNWRLEQARNAAEARKRRSSVFGYEAPEHHLRWLTAVTFNVFTYPVAVFLTLGLPITVVNSVPMSHGPHPIHLLDATRLALAWGGAFLGLGLLAAAILWSNLLYNSRPRKYRGW